MKSFNDKNHNSRQFGDESARTQFRPIITSKLITYGHQNRAKLTETYLTG